jgi:hypothetical protein
MSTYSTLTGIICFIAFAWVAYEVWAVNKGMKTVYKLLWTLAALFFSIITAIIYYLVEKRNAIS